MAPNKQELCLLSAPDEMGFEDNSKIIILLNKVKFCYPSLEPSHRDGLNEGPHHVFFVTPLYLKLCVFVLFQTQAPQKRISTSST